MKGKLFNNKSEYLEAARTGRGTSDRVTKTDKEVIWIVYEKYNQELKTRGQVDFDDYAILALKKIQNDTNFIPPYTHIIIDEAQDLNKAQILTISSLVDTETNSLSIIADAAQRIFKSGFVWSEVGINVRGGRTIEFKKNYRNTVHIAKAALSLLSNEKDQSEFTTVETALAGGEKPKIAYYSDFDEQLNHLDNQLTILKNSSNLKSTVVLHRSTNGVKQIKAFLDANGFSTELVKSNLAVNYGSDSIKICTMSSVKGLEFNNVFILDLNENILPIKNWSLDNNIGFTIDKLKKIQLDFIKIENKYIYCDYDDLKAYEFDKGLLDKISLNKKIKLILEDTKTKYQFEVNKELDIIRVYEKNDDEFHISTERKLLYTCMTRARNKLYLFSSDKNNPSRYLKEIDSDLLDDISINSDTPTQNFKSWKESLSYEWLNILQAHIELSYQEDFFNSYFSDDWSCWGDMMDGDEDIFSEYMMTFGKRIYPNYDLITEENILKIKSLNLIRLNLTDIKPLSFLTNVTQIQAYSNKISNIKGLESLTKLKYLSLYDNMIKSDTQLLELSRIVGLSIYKNPIKSIDEILTHKSLVELIAIECNISTISPQKDCSLKFLDVAHNDISKIDLEYLKDLESLRIESNPLKSIINELKHTKKLNQLFLDDTAVTKEEKEKIRSNKIEVYEWFKG